MAIQAFVPVVTVATGFHKNTKHRTEEKLLTLMVVTTATSCSLAQIHYYKRNRFGWPLEKRGIQFLIIP